jgi:hypothetical protein
VGSVFGVLANDGRQRIASAEASSLGLVTSLSREEALRIDQQAQLNALVADICFAAGGAFAVTGAALFIAGTVAPDRSGGAVVVGGRL